MASIYSGKTQIGKHDNRLARVDNVYNSYKIPYSYKCANSEHACIGVHADASTKVSSAFIQLNVKHSLQNNNNKREIRIIRKSTLDFSNTSTYCQYSHFDDWLTSAMNQPKNAACSENCFLDNCSLPRRWSWPIESKQRAVSVNVAIFNNSDSSWEGANILSVNKYFIGLIAKDNNYWTKFPIKLRKNDKLDVFRRFFNAFHLSQNSKMNYSDCCLNYFPSLCFQRHVSKFKRMRVNPSFKTVNDFNAHHNISNKCNYLGSMKMPFCESNRKAFVKGSRTNQNQNCYCNYTKCNTILNKGIGTNYIINNTCASPEVGKCQYDSINLPLFNQHVTSDFSALDFRAYNAHPENSESSLIFDSKSTDESRNTTAVVTTTTNILTSSNSDIPTFYVCDYSNKACAINVEECAENELYTNIASNLSRSLSSTSSNSNDSSHTSCLSDSCASDLEVSIFQKQAKSKHKVSSP